VIAAATTCAAPLVDSAPDESAGFDRIAAAGFFSAVPDGGVVGVTGWGAEPGLPLLAALLAGAMEAVACGLLDASEDLGIVDDRILPLSRAFVGTVLPSARLETALRVDALISADSGMSAGIGIAVAAALFIAVLLQALSDTSEVGLVAADALLGTSDRGAASAVVGPKAGSALSDVVRTPKFSTNGSAVLTSPALRLSPLRSLVWRTGRCSVSVGLAHDRLPSRRAIGGS
jgi:hypothetical protein